MKLRTRILVVVASAVLAVGPLHTAQEPSFVRIFDGKTLNGWTTPQPKLWSVENGVIIGRTTASDPVSTANGGWLIWTGEAGEFEFRAKFRITGSLDSNSGIQFRSATNREGNIQSGYQADIGRDPQTADLSRGGMGELYDAGTHRDALASRGQKTVIAADGKRETTQFGSPVELFKYVNIDGWNEYRVIARGHHLQAIINGHLMTEVIDNDRKFFHASGKIGLQLHHGQPMEVQFKDIFIKKYPAADPATSSVDPWAIESREARAALPEFQVEPAAKPTELTPANGYPHKAEYLKWDRVYGGNTNSRYSLYDQINRQNVSKLQVAWVYHSNDGKGNIECNPIIVDGVMYAPTPGQYMVALNAATGKEIWRSKAQGPHAAFRGLVYWKGEPGHPARILFDAGDTLYALDPKTGAPIQEFGDAGKVKAGMVSTAGAIYKHVFIVAGALQDVYGFDLFTGKLLWTFHTVPLPGEFGYDTWDKTQKGANCWGGIALDEQRGIVYINTGNPKPNFIGPEHLGRDLFSDCVLALNASTGQRLWHFQEIRHDVWDLDIPSPPNLVTITHDGRKIDAVAAVTKIGNTLLLDRVTGKPIFPFRLRRAPTSVLPGEQTWPYQPDPVLPEHLADLAFSLNDVTDISPEAHEYIMKKLEHAHMGWFEPVHWGEPTVIRCLHGGGEWTGGAVDPSGLMYLNTNNYPWIITLARMDEPPIDPNQPPTAGDKIYQENCMVCHGADRKGQGVAPTLRGLKERYPEDDLLSVVKNGRGQMPPFPSLTEHQLKDLMDFLYLRDRKTTLSVPGDKAPPQFGHTGYIRLIDQFGYPGVKPPWGNLVCLNLNTGKIVWKVPLGEYKELTAKGILNTGTPNMGGAIATAGGLVFCGGTRDAKIRAFDKATGKELWSGQLPYGGYAPPATYMVNHRQYIVIAATGAGFPGRGVFAGAAEPGDAWVAFALPEETK